MINATTGLLGELGAPCVWNVCDERKHEGHDDVFVSAVVKSKAWAAPGERRRKRADVGWGRHGKATLRSLPGQARGSRSQ